MRPSYTAEGVAITAPSASRTLAVAASPAIAGRLDKTVSSDTSSAPPNVTLAGAEERQTGAGMKRKIPKHQGILAAIEGIVLGTIFV